ncbi:MAG: 4Fe-4S binding protein [Nitrospirales bacterium]|nr:4Fe-4S binding protein [Nitrospirales bacterium]
MYIEVKRALCTGCGVCADSCPYSSIDIRDGKAWVTEYCQACGVCMGVCPEGALVLREPEKREVTECS